MKFFKVINTLVQIGVKLYFNMKIKKIYQSNKRNNIRSKVKRRKKKQIKAITISLTFIPNSNPKMFKNTRSSFINLGLLVEEKLKILNRAFPTSLIRISLQKTNLINYLILWVKINSPEILKAKWGGKREKDPVIDWLMNWLISSLIDWLIIWFINLLIDIKRKFFNFFANIACL